MSKMNEMDSRTTGGRGRGGEGRSQNQMYTLTDILFKVPCEESKIVTVVCPAQESLP